VLIDCWRQVVGWWDTTVRQNSRPEKSNSGTGLLSAAEAEQQLALRQQTISRFRTAVDPLAGVAQSGAVNDRPG
jgi:hypothetical protein